MEYRKTAKITTEKHIYEFVLLNAKDGLRLTHEYGSMILMAGATLKETIVPLAMTILAKSTESEDETKSVLLDELRSHGVDSIADAVRMIPQILTWDRLMEFSKLALAGADIDGEKLDEDGMGPIFQGDPLEFYTTCFWAVAANWPKYIDPLLEAPEDEGASASSHEKTPADSDR